MKFIKNDCTTIYQRSRNGARGDKVRKPGSGRLFEIGVVLLSSEIVFGYCVVVGPTRGAVVWCSDVA